MTYKLLIVDDSKLARMSVTKALKTLFPDCDRVEAANADEALARVKETSFDIALLDFNMPGRDGLELAAELRAAASVDAAGDHFGKSPERNPGPCQGRRRRVFAETTDRTSAG